VRRKGVEGLKKASPIILRSPGELGRKAYRIKIVDRGECAEMEPDEIGPP
jgi:hypothetical protein